MGEARYVVYLRSRFGMLKVECSDTALVSVRITVQPGEDSSNGLCREVGNQLEEYFAGKRRTFDLPLDPVGTEFQRKVWEALQAIPYGARRTYGEIAAVVGNPKASRAVGMANNRNPIMIIIPCHRVVGADGALTGYAGGLEMKQTLLELEAGSSSRA